MIIYLERGGAQGKPSNLVFTVLMTQRLMRLVCKKISVEHCERDEYSDRLDRGQPSGPL